MNLPTAHFATLCKYAGISFIAGAVNHGFFSGERSLLTAAIGVLVYLVGGILEMRASPDGSQRWVDLLGLGIVSSIGLGFFTGGLQHFPDSPARSAWVVPLGFAMSLLAYWLMQGRDRAPLRTVLGYGVGTGAVVLAGSLIAWQMLHFLDFSAPLTPFLVQAALTALAYPAVAALAARIQLRLTVSAD